MSYLKIYPHLSKNQWLSVCMVSWNECTGKKSKLPQLCYLDVHTYRIFFRFVLNCKSLSRRLIVSLRTTRGYGSVWRVHFPKAPVTQVRSIKKAFPSPEIVIASMLVKRAWVPAHRSGKTRQRKAETSSWHETTLIFLHVTHRPPNTCETNIIFLSGN